MPYYESKPQLVEAIQYTGDNPVEVGLFTRHPDEEPYSQEAIDNIHKHHEKGTPLGILAGKDGAQGIVDLPVGYYVVHKPGDYTDFWPVAPEYFEEKYRYVGEPYIDEDQSAHGGEFQ